MDLKKREKTLKTLLLHTQTHGNKVKLYCFGFFFLNLIFIECAAQRYPLFAGGQIIPMYYNPAFAGYTGYSRVTTALCAAGPMKDFQLKDRFFTPVLRKWNKGYFSFDHYFSKQKFSFALTTVSTPWYDVDEVDEKALKFPMGVSHIQRNNLEFALASKIKVNRKTMLTVGIAAGSSVFFRHKRMEEYEKAKVDTVGELESIEYLPNTSPLDYSCGALFHSKKYYAGYSFKAYSAAEISVDTIKKTHTLSRRMKYLSSLQATYVFERQSHNFSPTLIFQYDHKAISLIDLQVNLNYRFKKIVFGFGGSALAHHFILGYHGQMFRLYYTNGRTLKNPEERANIQEFVLTYVFADYITVKKKNKDKREEK